jgi:hypothetical protein
MSSEKKNEKRSFALILICVSLMATAGIIGYSSGNMIPVEIQMKEPEKLREVTDVPTTSTTTENQVDVLKSSLDAAVGMIQEAPKFVFLFGSKLLSSLDENLRSENTTEDNVFSVVGSKPL